MRAAVLEAIDGRALARAVELAELLVHDVGKQVARTAVNLRDDEAVPEVLAGMLVADLFESASGGPALARFEELAAELEALLSDDRIAQVRKLLAHAGDQERAMRDGDDGALRSAARRARLVHEVLRTLVLDLRSRAEDA